MLLVLVVLFVIIFLLVGFIRGIHRHSMINKYQYDYYGEHNLSVFQKLVHNFVMCTCSITTFVTAAILTAVAYGLIHYFDFNGLMFFNSLHFNTNN